MSTLDSGQDKSEPCLVRLEHGFRVVVLQHVLALQLGILSDETLPAAAIAATDFSVTSMASPMTDQFTFSFRAMISSQRPTTWSSFTVSGLALGSAEAKAAASPSSTRKVLVEALKV